METISVSELNNSAPTEATIPVPEEVKKNLNLFDSRGEFPITIRSGGDKSCVVRYPSDAEWCARTRKQKIVTKSLGRGKSVPVPQRAEIEDAKLFSLIRLDADSGVEFDDAEAAEVIGRLDSARVTDVVRHADGYKLTMKMMRYTTSHVLCCPTASQSMKHSREAVYPMDDDRLRILRFALEPSVKLYDDLVRSASGYAPGSLVPAPHKFAAVFELLRFIEKEMSEDEDLEDAGPES